MRGGSCRLRLGESSDAGSLQRVAANLALATKAAMFREMGLEVSVCGTEHGL